MAAKGFSGIGAAARPRGVVALWRSLAGSLGEAAGCGARKASGSLELTSRWPAESRDHQVARLAKPQVCERHLAGAV